MGTQGNNREVWDYVDLVLLRLAKVERIKAAEGNKKFYEEFFTRDDAQILGSERDLRRSYRGAVLKNVAAASIPEGGKVLDVGCGTGDNLAYIHQPNVEFFGMEYAESTANMAKELLGDKVDIRTGSANAIPFPDAQFDFALCIEVLEHIEDDIGALKEISRVLKPGGKLVMSVPYRYWFPSYFNLMGHYRHYTRQDVEKMLTTCAMTPIQHLENYPRWSRFANYCYIVCRLYAMLLRVVGRRVSPVDVSVPFSKRNLLDVLFSAIEPMRKKEAGMDYSDLPTSTFILAQKHSSAAPSGVE